jgi:hypothetical protein
MICLEFDLWRLSCSYSKKVPLKPQKRKITKRTHFLKEGDTVDGTKGRFDWQASFSKKQLLVISSKALFNKRL